MGRPPDKEKHDAFVKSAKFLEENDGKQITVSDLIEKMEEYLRVPLVELMEGNT